MSSTTKQRREQILERIYENGSVEVKDLALMLEVSEATVRRDLRTLADERKIELFYGGATLPQASDFSFRSKAQRNIEAKRMIGRLAGDLVKDGDTIFVDSGTTCFEMCPVLRRRRNLTVIVNSARLATELGAMEGLNLIVIGGQYRPERMDLVGPLAISTLEQLRGFVAFIGADGISRDFGITAGDIDIAHLNRVAVHHSRETVLVVDHTKLVSPSLYRITEFDAINRIVTDRKPAAEWLTFFDDHGIELLLPPGEQ